MTNRISEIEFEKLVYDYQGLIHKVCNIYFSSEADKEDLFQDITINLWKGLPSFKGNSKLSTWIFRVSLNTALTKLRKSKRSRIFYSDKIYEKGSVDSDDRENTDLQTKALYFGIDKLKPLEKAIILLHLEEHPNQEIADIIGITKNNLTVKLVRIRKKLKKIIEEFISKNE